MELLQMFHKYLPIHILFEYNKFDGNTQQQKSAPAPGRDRRAGCVNPVIWDSPHRMGIVTGSAAVVVRES